MTQKVGMERLTRLPETAKDDNFPQVGRAGSRAEEQA